jgi:glycosyltransferase involved in cell wall biosynthesis
MTLLSEEPLFSVIIPVYNAEATVERTIRSVLKQTYQQLEIIVILDGATDNSEATVRGIQDDRIHCFSQKNQGVAVARNYGASLAKGEYFAFLDADDAWFPEHLSHVLATFKAQTNPVALAYSPFYAFDENKDLINLSPTYTDSGNVLLALVNNEGMFLPSNTVLHREVFEHVGGFESGIHYEDFHFFLMATAKFPAYPTLQRSVLYFQSLSGRGRSKKFQDFDISVATYVEENPALKRLISPEAYEAFMMRQKRSLFFSYLMYNAMDFAKRFYPQLDKRTLFKGNKGKLARITMLTGFNFLYTARLIYQTYTRILLRPWWHSKSQAVLG